MALTENRRATVALLAVIVAAGLFLRLINIGAEPYWGDEVLSLDIVRHFGSVPEMVRYVREVEFHPPLYYLLLRPWTGLFGVSEAATRSLSLVFSLGAIAVVYALGRALFGTRRAGLVAALAMAILPMQVEFGQEARPYAMVSFAGAVAALGLWKHLRTGRPAYAAVYAAATVFGLYLSYSYFLVAAAMAGWWAIEAALAPKAARGRAVVSFAVVHAAVFLAYYPWLDAFLAKLALSDFLIFGLPRPEVPARQIGFLGSVTDQLVWLTKQRALPQVILFAQFLFKAAFLAAAFAVVRSLDRAKAGALARPAAFTAWLIVAPLILFMFSPLSLPYAPVYVRHAIFVTVPVALAVAAVASRLDARRAVALTALFAVTLVPSLIEITGNDARWDPFHRIGEVGAYISEHYRPGDLVITSYSSGRSDLAHYVRPEAPVVAFIPLNYYDRDVWNTRATLGLVENESQVRSWRGLTGAGIAGDAPSGGDGVRVTPEAIEAKLGYLEKLHAPERVWLHGFSAKDTAVHAWFRERGWRHAFWNIAGLFALDLYVKDNSYALQP